jgi:hypothetical protein
MQLSTNWSSQESFGWTYVPGYDLESLGTGRLNREQIAKQLTVNVRDLLPRLETIRRELSRRGL